MKGTYATPTDALQGMARCLLESGEVPSRNGTTREQLMNQITIMWPLDRVIAVAERKASVPAQIAEAAWILAGRNDIEWLSNYLPRAAEFSDDGKVWRGGYGPRLRRWGEVDQLAHVVRLLKSAPETRRAVISLYNPAIDTAPGKDIPCNDLLHFIARGESLHLHVVTRSNDLIWGWSGVNQFEWSVLLEVVARLTGFEMGAITYSITSLHLYERHYKKAEVIASSPTADIGVTPPRFDLDNLGQLDDALADFFETEKGLRENPQLDHSRLIEQQPDPMLRSWLMVLAYWWSGRGTYLAELEDTSLAWGARNSLGSPVPPAPQMSIAIAELHQRKDKAYGDSWKRRGEQVGIQANIARKVDRLGAAGDQDETALDTAIDLLVYLLKYEAWLDEQAGATGLGTEDERVRRGLARLEKNGNDAITTPDADYCQNLDNRFTDLLQTWHGRQRVDIVRGMIAEAWDLCSLRWAESQRSTDAAEMRRQLWKQGNETRPWNPEAGQ